MRVDREGGQENFKEMAMIRESFEEMTEIRMAMMLRKFCAENVLMPPYY